jgi:glutaredoxin
MSLVSAAVAVLLGGMALAASAEIYRYTDNKGQICFVDDIAKVPKKYRKQVRSADDLDGVSVVQSPATPARRPHAPQATPQREAARRYSGAVELYSADWCPHCRKAEAYMRSQGIPYVKHDIEKDPAAKRRYDELGGGGVPLIIVGSHRMTGFSPASLEYQLGR